jgi:hypothetical protein
MMTQRDERSSLARRLVADRCLYGVDVNQLAVEMAKLSIWLITLAKDTPFSFLDHALKCGDSLLGVHSLDQIQQLTLSAGTRNQEPQSMFVPSDLIRTALDEASATRQELKSFVTRDIYDAARKLKLHQHADRSVSNVRLMGDLVVGMALAGGKSRSAAHDAIFEQVRLWLATRDAQRREQLIVAVKRLIGIRLDHQRMERRPIHWPIEYPEVFDSKSRGFDAIVMNPPFLGSQRTRHALGDAYREYLFSTIGRGVRGIADLCAFFLLRAAQLVSQDSTFGSLATNTVAQGDTRRVGLDQLVQEGRIYRAVRTRLWPGLANTESANFG